MATTTRPRRPRAAAQPEIKNVTTRRGGKVHALHPAIDTPFPACRTGSQTRLPSSRYAYTTAEINCEKCLPTEPVAAPEKPTRSPRAARARRNGTAQAEASQQAAKIVAEETYKIIAKRDDQWSNERKPGCSDEDYALAVQVRTLRQSGGAWWAIAHAMGLKGSGPSVKLGKTGAAHARRLWERAWGPTYRDTTVKRETKAIRSERALTQPGKPYFSPDALDQEIVDAVNGHEITWMTRVAAGDGVVVSEQTAQVKPGSARVVQGPKGRVVVFFEMVYGDKKVATVGPQRSVYIDRIEKVAL